MSHYLSTCYVITNDKQLLKLRNIKHMVPPHTNKRTNAKIQQIYYNVTLKSFRVIILVSKIIKPYLFWVWAFSLNYRASNAQAQYNIVVSGLPFTTTLYQLFHQTHNFQKDVNRT